MVSGNVANMPKLLGSVRFLTTAVASEMSYASGLQKQALFSIALVLFVFIRRLLFGDPVAGWASTICIVLFIGGVQLLCMGIMGQYLAKTYLEVKRRPHYIVAESNNPDVLRIK